MTDTKKKGPARSGSLYWTKSGWRARLRVEVDGETIQKSFDLETTDKQVANIRLRRLVAQHVAPVAILETEAARVETFKEATERIVGESTIRTKKARLDRLRRLAYPTLGAKPVSAVVAGDVRSVLKSLADDGYSRQQCLHMRNDISAVLGELWRCDMLPENVCEKVKLPSNAKVDSRERTVLEDDEILVYLAWQHPNEKRQRAVLERQVMACIARVFGAPRWGDIRACRWEYFEIAGGEFPKGWTTRKKAGRAQALVVPPALRPILRDFWERKGRPTSGLMFPVRKGKRAGEERKPASIARALRRDLARAFGIEAPMRVELVRSNQRKDTRDRWEVVREMTQRERELLTETEFTKPTDFHSFRRAFKQGLADAGVELQTAMALSGANDAAAHQRYLKNTSKVREIPAAALPLLSMSHAQLLFPTTANQQEIQCRETDLNRRHHAYEAMCIGGSGGNPTRSARVLGLSPTQIPRDPSPPCTEAMHSSPLGEAAYFSASAYLRAVLELNAPGGSA